MNDLLSTFSIKESLKSLLSRSPDNISSLDGWRAFSILWLMLFHSVTLSAYLTLEGGVKQQTEAISDSFGWLMSGHYAVDIFFVLSGFLIADMLLKEKDTNGSINLKRFYLRRLLRLSPSLVLLILYTYLTKGFNYQLLLYNLFYINNFLSFYDAPIGWTWSLAVEEQFYLLFPLILLLLKPEFYLRGFVALFILAVAIRVILLLLDNTLVKQLSELVAFEKSAYHFYSTLYDNLHTRFGSLICGILALYLYRYKRQKVQAFFASGVGTVALITAVVTFISIPLLDVKKEAFVLTNFQLYLHHGFARYTFSLAAATIILAVLVKAPLMQPLNRLFSMNIWHYIAQLTYSLFLFHIPVIFSFAWPLVNGMIVSNGSEFGIVNIAHLAMVTVITFITSFAVAIIVYLLIERPFMNLREKLHWTSLTNSSNFRPPVKTQ